METTEIERIEAELKSLLDKPSGLSQSYSRAQLLIEKQTEDIMDTVLAEDIEEENKTFHIPSDGEDEDNL